MLECPPTYNHRSHALFGAELDIGLTKELAFIRVPGIEVFSCFAVVVVNPTIFWAPRQWSSCQGHLWSEWHRISLKAPWNAHSGSTPVPCSNDQGIRTWEKSSQFKLHFVCCHIISTVSSGYHNSETLTKFSDLKQESDWNTSVCRENAPSYSSPKTILGRAHYPTCSLLFDPENILTAITVFWWAPGGTPWNIWKQAKHGRIDQQDWPKWSSGTLSTTLSKRLFLSNVVFTTVIATLQLYFCKNVLKCYICLVFPYYLTGSLTT